MRQSFLIYEEMRKYFPIYEEAGSHIWLCNCSALNFPIYEENFLFFFISAETLIKRQVTWHDCLPSLLGDDGGKWSETMYCEEKNICTGPTKASKAGQKSLVLSRRAQRTNQPFYVFSSEQVELYNYFYVAGSGSPSRAGWILTTIRWMRTLASSKLAAVSASKEY